MGDAALLSLTGLWGEALLESARPCVPGLQHTPSSFLRSHHTLRVSLVQHPFVSAHQSQAVWDQSLWDQTIPLSLGVFHG